MNLSGRTRLQAEALEGECVWLFLAHRVQRPGVLEEGGRESRQWMRPVGTEWGDQGGPRSHRCGPGLAEGGQATVPESRPQTRR